VQPILPDENLNFFRAELCRFSAKAYAMGLCAQFTGLLSVRLPPGDRVLVTPAGALLGEIGPENLILLDLEENIIAKPEGVIVPTDTTYVINSYKKRRDIFAIGHFHPPFATAYSITTNGIPLITAHSRRTLKEILRVKCRTCPSRFEGLCLCIEGQRKSYAGVNVLLLEGNGIVTLGKNLTEVLSFAGLVEETARIAWLFRNISIKTDSEPH
jgi:ribulose-5-phosphate 4-epimerase/fuculose-1-phosphate aldolase